MARGFADAGGFVFGWDQGYDGPMNSLRLAKSFFLALLVTPFMVGSAQDPGLQNQIEAGVGIGAGPWLCHACCTLGTAGIHRAPEFLFGLPLDGALLGDARRRRGARRLAAADGTVRDFSLGIPMPGTKAAAMALAFLGGYAALTTFSRATYLALAISIPFLIWRLGAQASAESRAGPDDSRLETRHWIVALILFALMIAPMFSGGGYRGVLTLLGLAFVALSTPQSFRELQVARKLAGMAGGLTIGAFLIVASNYPEGPLPVVCRLADHGDRHYLAQKTIICRLGRKLAADRDFFRHAAGHRQRSGALGRGRGAAGSATVAVDPLIAIGRCFRDEAPALACRHCRARAPCCGWRRDSRRGCRSSRRSLHR